jgi:DNA invertase Pin-like site-specific DNA recombinase
VKTADAYIRVSKVGGRSGESFISPAEQRAAIEAWSKATGTTILEWHEDLDESGGTLDRPGFQAALERCRTGVTGGIAAAKLDRLTRSVQAVGALIEEARAGGWNLVALDLGLDLKAANGKLVANVLGSVAEWERDRRRDDWAVARRNAIERGIPNGRVPFGYRKRPDGRPEVVEAEARLVRQAFQERAAGTPFTEVGRPYGWSHSTTRQIIRNRAYIGVARCGQLTNEQAFPPIVTVEDWEAAQSPRRERPVPTGATTADRLLLGVARCGGCGRTLKVVRAPRANGRHVVSYYCKNQASEACTARAFASADTLDELVADWFERALTETPRMIDAVEAGRELDDARTAHDDALHELHGYVEAASALDPDLFRRGLDARQARVDLAREAVAQLSARVSRLPLGGTLAELWQGFDPGERREVLAGFLGQVLVRGSNADGALDGRITILWADGTLAYPEVEVADEERRLRVTAA